MVAIGIIGCGTMGSEVATAVAEGRVGNAKVSAIYDQDMSRANILARVLADHVKVVLEVQDMLDDPGISVVVECASQQAAREYGVPILEAGKDMLMISSGALVDQKLFRSLSKAADKTNCQLLVPSGALGGIDALRAARGYIDEITLVSTKRPKAFSGAPGFAQWEDEEIKKPTVLYDGPASDAASLFPANINVAATVSLAGLGPDLTKVRVVADPESPGNVHEVHAKGGFGEARIKLINRPHERNPKTSLLAVLSVIETLRTLCGSGLRIGT